MGKPSFYLLKLWFGVCDRIHTVFTQVLIPRCKGCVKREHFCLCVSPKMLVWQIVASAIYTPHMRRRSQCHIHMQQQSQKPLCLLQVNILSLQFLLSIRQDSCELTNYMPHTERFTEAVKNQIERKNRPSVSVQWYHKKYTAESEMLLKIL